MRLRVLTCLPMLASLAGPVAAQGTVPPVAEQLAAAVLPLPADLRAGATVMGYKSANKLEVLKQGSGSMICLALYVTRPDFHVACYYKGLEPFMARGRELRDKGVANVDSVRFKEIADGRLRMPAQGALYEITVKDKKAWNPKTGKVAGATPLAVIYVPFATAESTGLSPVPNPDGPWLMLPGTAKAHIMLMGKMQM
ncbi:MAG TPA: hypothetical protein VG916_06465 [Gemmatimonadaceae bacterium]|nr:hypothetical protein [Gemmatimonadaceae bacterium]